MENSGTHARIEQNNRSRKRGHALIAAVALAAVVAFGHVPVDVSYAGAQAKAPVKPQEGTLQLFLGKVKFDQQQLFEGGRFPNVVVATDGTVLAFWGRDSLPQVRRSEDGGAKWEPIIQVGQNPEHAGKGLGAAVVDETTGDVVVFMEGAGGDWDAGHCWRSRDHGKTWEHNGATTTIVKPNTPVQIGGTRAIPARGSTHGADSAN